MSRFKSVRTIVCKKFKTIKLNGEFADTLGEPESNGLWLIYGLEKMGKTTFALQLAAQLAHSKKVLYISAEQGFDKDFSATAKRILGSEQTRILLSEYLPVYDLKQLLLKRRTPDVIVLDNATVYSKELNYKALQELIHFKSKLFILIAHEENSEPYGATAKMAKKLAKRVIHVEGNKAFIDGRTQGGTITINDDKAQLYHGSGEAGAVLEIKN